MSSRAERAVAVLGVASLGVYCALFFTGGWVDCRQLGDRLAQSKRLGLELLAERGVRADSLDVLARFQRNDDLFDYLGSVLNREAALRVFRDRITPYRLELGWGPPRDGGKQNAVADRRYTLSVDAEGRIQAFRLPPEEATAQARAPGDTAAKAGARWMGSTLGVDVAALDPEPDVVQDMRAGVAVDTVTWEGKDPDVLGATLALKIELKGSSIIGFERKRTLPPLARSELDRRGRLVRFLPLSGMFVVLGLAFLVFIQRVRREQIDFRLGGVAGAAMFFGFVLGQGPLLAQEPDLEGIAWIFATLVNGFLFGLLVLTVVAAGESIAREQWPEKMATIDRLLAGHFFSRSTGKAILIGSCVGMAWLAAEQLVRRWILPPLSGIGFQSETLLGAVQSSVPALCLLGIAVVSVVLAEGTTRLFLLSWLRVRIRSERVVAVLGTLIATGVLYPRFQDLRPVEAGLALSAIVNVMIVGAWLGGELAIGVWATLFQALIGSGLRLLAFGGAPAASGGVLLAGCAAVVGLAGMAVERPRPPRQRPYIPPYVSRLQERARQHHELELARQAQLSILPRSVPVISGFDVATVCVPAMEVGGDYFDFFPLGDRRLGVVIGDVSGKGIRAALYMTLAKGILLPLASSGRLSPREVLLRLNELFFRQAERGVFLSVVYGEFDLDRRTLTVARAGHNPLIVLRAGSGSSIEIAPEGIAIGLDRGKLFDSTLEERTIALAAGDMFLFYTDGFTEAMNANREEFGEERMCNVLLQSASGDAATLVSQINVALQEFVAGTPQHDDMTMVLVRITDPG